MVFFFNKMIKYVRASPLLDLVITNRSCIRSPRNTLRISPYFLINKSIEAISRQQFTQWTLLKICFDLQRKNNANESSSSTLNFSNILFMPRMWICITLRFLATMQELAFSESQLNAIIGNVHVISSLNCRIIVTSKCNSQRVNCSHFYLFRYPKAAWLEIGKSPKQLLKPLC